MMLTSGQAPAGTTGQLPSSMAALGDSLTRGFNSCGWLFDCTVRSWATGDSEEVASHYARILAANPDIEGRAHNDAKTGAESTMLPEQAQRAVEQNVDYVTIFIGANDVCAKVEDNITSTADYRANVNAALAILKQGLPSAQLLVVSVPDVVRLWKVAHTNPEAVSTWRVFNGCDTVLRNPTSTDAADNLRRQRMSDQVDEYNEQLKQACRDYGSRCRYDGGLVHDYKFTMDQISTWDYFHLNAKGQAAISAATYPW